MGAAGLVCCADNATATMSAAIVPITSAIRTGRSFASMGDLMCRRLYVPFVIESRDSVALSPGDALGPYEIQALVGKGGMGEVYRAHDSRLNRDVAIKVSNVEFTERFTREARAIAALNHTNICHLYDVAPNYLVMEYVEGETLQGPTPRGDAL